MTTTTAPAIVLDIHICAQRRGYRATFEGPDAETMAIDFLEARKSTHAFYDVESEPIDVNRYPLLAAYMDPECEHGLSLSNCYGPQHYYFDEEEQARGLFNS